MSSVPMKDRDGRFELMAGTYKCRKCDKYTAKRESWDSDCGGYTDYRYTCKECGYFWWIEGSDA